MKEIKFIEVKDIDAENVDVELGTLRRVEVSVFWRYEQNKVFDVPVEMSLDEVRNHVTGLYPNSHDGNFKFEDSDLTEFDCWLVSDLNTNEEWWI